MEDKFYFSASKLGFYRESQKESYQQPDSWPSDLIEITEEKRDELLKGNGEGSVISADKDGYPVLIPPPLPTKDEYISLAKAEKASRQADAQIAIAPLQNAVDIDDATDAEIALLKKWKQYSVAVNRIDTSTAPDITWAIPPAS
ncbi:tail fiber assembly protein [Erwinia sp. JH02]|uniref:tail fiber assembly protein n=1 Tax=Erwinia sp. JH02 TaxID=2733394 RepID=UPI001487645C|nr:tail fiber assembly protein [Erwinia sp. JH02]NNS07351.1 hypothetical protein [Erwinia sp. JH02]